MKASLHRMHRLGTTRKERISGCVKVLPAAIAMGTPADTTTYPHSTHPARMRMRVLTGCMSYAMKR